MALFAFISCGKKNNVKIDETPLPAQSSIEIKGDSMVYGLSCDGSGDSVIVVWRFGGDPVTYNIIDARREGRVIGQPVIGDWVGVMVDPEDSTEATMLIDLDQLKGTWTYPVLPVMKDFQHMSKRMQKRMMENMPDSVKETFFVPREYGFVLKRGHQAQSVGRVMRSNSLSDDSPVQYPDVQNYKNWYMLNGKLILVSGDPILPNATAKSTKPDKIDTLEFQYMDQDSLILTFKGQRYGFHRKENAMKANAEATKAQQKIEAKK